jgi:hypothetical protein
MVFSTRPVREKGYPILLVTHDDNGDWQFLCDTTTDVKDGLVLHLAHIVDAYPDVHELADLPRGWIAERESEGRPWRRSRRPADWKT